MEDNRFIDMSTNKYFFVNAEILWVPTSLHLLHWLTDDENYLRLAQHSLTSLIVCGHAWGEADVVKGHNDLDAVNQTTCAWTVEQADSWRGGWIYPAQAFIQVDTLTFIFANECTPVIWVWRQQCRVTIFESCHFFKVQELWIFVQTLD